MKGGESPWAIGNRKVIVILQYHIIFVCKYRKKLLTPWISEDIKRLSAEICAKHQVQIPYMETDKDRIHYMIETPPNINLADLIKTMKSYTSYHIWRLHKPYLWKCFWNEHTFWTDGNFLCSVGAVSEKILKEYIENQGQGGRTCVRIVV